MPPDLVVRGRRVVTPDGVRPAAVHVRDGLIERVAAHDDTPAAATLIDVGDDALLPGLVDSHVHINDPGRADWEGFATATRAAAAGGVTTLVDMPLNSLPPTTTAGALALKVAAAEGSCHVDVAFWGGLVPGGVDALRALLAAGARGVKAFLADSGVPEFPPVELADLAAALPVLALHDAPALVHAEAPGALARAAAGVAGRSPRDYATWLASRPEAAECDAVAALALLAQDSGAQVHVVHLSSAAALEPLGAARSAGARLTAETCPHYLVLSAEEVPDGATEFKCAPPIRDAANAERLWAALAEGRIDMVVSDHSPCPPAAKRPDTGDFLAAWGGIASLELRLPLVWTAGRRHGVELCDLAEWLSRAPARLARLPGKGAIAAGRDADLVAFDTNEEGEVRPERLQQRHKVTPYAGRRLAGAVRRTWLRGHEVFAAGVVVEPARGRALLEPAGIVAGTPTTEVHR